MAVALPGFPVTTIRGDSTACTYVATPMRTPFIVASLTSIVSPAGDSIDQGSVDAWLSEYRPGTGPAFRVLGTFRALPGQ